MNEPLTDDRIRALFPSREGYEHTPYGSKEGWQKAFEDSPSTVTRVVAARLLEAIRTNNPWHIAWVEVNYLLRVFLHLDHKLTTEEDKRRYMSAHGLIGEPLPITEYVCLIGLANALEQRYGRPAKCHKALHYLATSAVMEVLTRTANAPATAATGRDGAAEVAPPPASTAASKPPPLTPLDASDQSCQPSSPASASSEEGRVARERASAEHRRALAALETHLTNLGLSCACSSLLDATVEAGGERLLFEVKSIADDGRNELDQVRAALAQLLDYRFRYRQETGFERPSLWVVLSLRPTLKWTPAFLAAEGIRLLWIEADTIQGPDAAHLETLARKPYR